MTTEKEQIEVLTKQLELVIQTSEQLAHENEAFRQAIKKGNEVYDQQRQKLSENYPDLRDQFAMAAMTVVGSITTDAKEAAKKAYGIADAMIKERGRD